MRLPKRARVLILALALSVGGVVIASQPATSASPPGVTRAAFYYPWFPETEGWATQYTPSLGKYDSSNSTILASHVAMAKHAGLDAFISSWWGVGTKTGDRLQAVLDAASAQDFKVTPYYEPESLIPAPTQDRLNSDLDHLYAQSQGAGKPGWLVEGTKPVLFVYNAGNEGNCAAVTRMKTASEGRFYLNMKVFSGYEACADQPDSWHQYGPAVGYHQHGTFSSNVSPGFWLFSEAAPRLARDLTRFKADLERQKSSGTKWQLITSFNEWGEGTSIEPADQWKSASGFGTYIDAIRAAYATPASTTAPPPSTTSAPPPSTTSAPPPPSTTAPPPPAAELVVWAAGDNCDDDLGVPGCKEVGNMIKTDAETDAFLALGDLQYENGELANFNTYYDPGMGKQQKFADGRSIYDLTVPTSGNHEYHTSGATGYYSYWGSKAGDPTRGFHAKDLGKWTMIATNSSCTNAGGCSASTPQGQFIATEMAAANAEGDHVIVFDHDPPYTDGNYAPGTADGKSLMNQAYDKGADIFLSGHDHNYQRWGPIAKDGTRQASGINYFVSGLGGKSGYAFKSGYNGALARYGGTSAFPGALRLVLKSDGTFSFQFKTTDGTVRDSGSGSSR